MVTVSLDCRLLLREGAGTLWLKGFNGIGDRECFGILRYAQDDSKNKRQQEQTTARTNDSKNKQRQEQTTARTNTQRQKQRQQRPTMSAVRMNGVGVA
jgi:C4-dicarboxylate-specific signal transduction histidine kinase